ncbi:hypothetical protein SDC9_82505 [bioreactor metagenome]|uniref:Uncharacterized protein n=1 Tax=bioreactor metagenome TaxID=1076179 RepID=A0A644Z7C9_9ZZZZ
MDMGVTEILLFIMGIPNSFSVASTVSTKCSDNLAILSYIFILDFSPSESAQSRSEMPIVIVLMSNLSSSTILTVSSMFLDLIISSIPRTFCQKYLPVEF